MTMKTILKTIAKSATTLLLTYNLQLITADAQTVFTSNFETWNDSVPTDWMGTETSFSADSVLKDSASVYQGKICL